MGRLIAAFLCVTIAAGGSVAFVRYVHSQEASSIPDPFGHIADGRPVVSRVDCDPVLAGVCTRWIVLSPVVVTTSVLAQEAADIAMRSLGWRRGSGPSSYLGLGVGFRGPSRYGGGVIASAAAEYAYWQQPGHWAAGDPDGQVLNAMRATPEGIVVEIDKTDSQFCSPTAC